MKNYTDHNQHKARLVELLIFITSACNCKVLLRVLNDVTNL